MCMSYTFLIGKERIMQDEELSRIFTNRYNLMLDQNFLKLYLAQSINNSNKLIFTESSRFYQKFLFLFALHYWEIPTGLKRSPSMCKRNITSIYK